jgi:hypothetical protein
VAEEVGPELKPQYHKKKKRKEKKEEMRNRVWQCIQWGLPLAPTAPLSDLKKRTF